MDSQLIDMWNWTVMDTCLIYQAEVVEVGRLDKLKETALKMLAELERIFDRAHLVVDKEAARKKILSAIDSGKIEPAQLLDYLDKLIENAKNESLIREQILCMAEKFLSACEEEKWLEDYDRKNRYSSSGSVSYLDRAAAKKKRAEKARAEKARILVNEIPALIHTLVAKTSAWEKALKMSFKYKDAPLLAMLDDYAVLRNEREEGKQRKKEMAGWLSNSFSKEVSSFDDQYPFKMAGWLSDSFSAFDNETVSKSKRVQYHNPQDLAQPDGPSGKIYNFPSYMTPSSDHHNSRRPKTIRKRLRRLSSSKEDAASNVSGSGTPSRWLHFVNHVSISKEDTDSHVSGTEPMPTSP